jgi:pimeloyl-ACP methyl ester carboxylesterase
MLGCKGKGGGAYGPSRKPSGRPGIGLPANTPPLGMLGVQVLGPPGGPLAIAMHGANPAWNAITEFDVAASRLAEEGYRVLLPNLHSNHFPAPSTFGPSINDAGSHELLVDLVELHTSGTNARGVLPLLLGKSWGGGAVTRPPANPPEMVQRLVLVCPGPVQAQTAPSKPKRRRHYRCHCGYSGQRMTT